jgi:hypothetical protein
MIPAHTTRTPTAHTQFLDRTEGTFARGSAPRHHPARMTGDERLAVAPIGLALPEAGPSRRGELHRACREW